LRVCLVLDWHPGSIGGVQSHVRDLARLLSSRGFDVCIVSRRIGEGDIDIEYSEGHYLIDSILPIETLFVPPDPNSLVDALFKLKPDIVHSHHIFTLTPLFALKAASNLNIARLATNHSIFLAYDFRFLWNTISLILPTRYYLQYSQAVVSISKAADLFVESIMGSDFKAKRYVIPGGVDSNKFTPPEKEPEDDIVLFIGRLVYRKGLHVLIKAFSRIASKRDIKLYVIGKGYMEIPARILAKTYGVDNKIHFLGVIPEHIKPNIYRKAKIVVVPSIFNESLGIVALEAMASGRPVIASNVGGLSELIVNGETGLLVEPGDEDSIGEAIEKLLEDKNLRLKLGNNARKIIEEKYSWDVVVDKIIRVYEELLNYG